MMRYFEVIKKCSLFVGIGEAELRTLLTCLSATEKRYEKNSFIFQADEAVTSVGVVLSGSVHVLKEDFWGIRTIFAHMEAGELFGEAFSCAEIERLPVSVHASETSDIMLIDYRKIVTACSSSCAFHTGLIKNMMRILARKNVMLTQKIEYITRRTTREKLLSYLSAQALRANSHSFFIPFNRQELAEYLSVDRSAMSGELCKMRDEGMIKFHKNHFELFDIQ